MAIVNICRRFGMGFEVVKLTPMARHELWSYGYADIRLVQSHPWCYFYFWHNRF